MLDLYDLKVHDLQGLSQDYRHSSLSMNEHMPFTAMKRRQA
jgi:hypothetical protein